MAKNKMAKPNVLLITGDHTRHDAVACNLDERRSESLSRVVLTPNFDKLALEGVTFANSFTPNPMCVPARAAITTGNYSHKCTGDKGNDGCIKDGQVKIAEYFVRNGYKTAAIGKLHYVPYSGPGQPRLLHGFQHAELCEEGRIIRQFDPEGVTTGLEDYHDYLKTVGWAGFERAHGIGNNDVHPSPSPLPEEYHEEAWVARRSIAFIEEHRRKNPDCPFLLWTSFAKPHPPYDPPRPYDALYDPRKIPESLGLDNAEKLLAERDRNLYFSKYHYAWDSLSPQALKVIRAYYCGMMTFQDKMIGRILEYLEESGDLESTIILYTADHGDLLGDFGRFFKSNMFDGSVKVPFILRVPGMCNGGCSIRQQLVGLQDVLPTLASLAGIHMPENIDGIDVSPYIAAPETPGREFYVSQCFNPTWQKYMIRTEKFKYVYTEAGGIEELYEVALPDYELENLSANPGFQDIKRELRGKLVAWCQENGDRDMLDGDDLRCSDPEEMKEDGFKSVKSGNFGWRKY